MSVEEVPASGSFSACSISYVIVTILDIFLFFFLQPICGTAFWVGLSYLYIYHSSKYTQIIVLISCTIIYVIMHIAPVPIYKFVRAKISSDWTFAIVADAYIYVNACTMITYVTGIFEVGLSTDDLLVTISFTVVSWWALLYLKCRPQIAGGVGSYPHIKHTPENLLLFPNTRFGSKVSLTSFVYRRLSPPPPHLIRL